MGDNNPDIEMRNCPCGSTINREHPLGFPTPNPASLHPVAVIMEGARRVDPEKWFDDHRVFIADIYDQLVDDHMNHGMNLADFKREIVRLWTEGDLTLARPRSKAWDVRNDVTADGDIYSLIVVE